MFRTEGCCAATLVDEKIRHLFRESLIPAVPRVVGALLESPRAPRIRSAKRKKILLMDELGRGFARAIRVGDTIFVAGVTGRLDLKTWKEMPEVKGKVGLQATQAFEWLRMVLEKCGSSLDRVFKLNIYIVDFDQLQEIWEAYGKYFPRNPPVVNMIGVSRLVGIAQIEVDAEALA
jgi:2-iminobutanoate/2-iminopropanoate deaminase